jgi:hypothetical protein
MPRPPYKRTKLHHPAQSKRVAKTSNVSPVVELQHKLANKPMGRVLTDSDDSDRLITSNRNGRNRRGIPRKDIYASGGVGVGDVPGAHRSQTQNSQASQRLETRKATEEAKQFVVNQQGEAAGVANPAVSQPKHAQQVAEKGHLPAQSSPAALGSASATGAPARLQTTPRAETSILGNIKPRRRQPSILQQLENNDSSNIGEEDEDDFFPNDESTPLNHSAAQQIPSAPHSSISNRSISRKRKLSPPITLVAASQTCEKSPRPETPYNTTASDERESEPELPPSPSATAPKRVTPELPDPDIMAPPLSSSPLRSPAKSKTGSSPVKQPPGRGRKHPAAPSTSELQALMPVRRQRKGRLRSQPLGEFDIPADTEGDGTTSPAITPGADDSSFRPAEVKGSRKSKPATKNHKAKPPSERNPVRIEGKKDRGRRDKSTISPTKLVTPLKTRPAGGAQKSATKSSSLSQQPDGQGLGHGTAKGKEKAMYSYSSRRRREISGDKENRPVDLSEDFSGSLDEDEADEGDEADCEKVCGCGRMGDGV